MNKDIFYVNFDDALDQENYQGWYQMDSVNDPLQVGTLLMSTSEKTSFALFHRLKSKTKQLKKIVIHQLRHAKGGLKFTKEIVLDHPRLSLLINDSDNTVIEFRDFEKGALS